MVPNLGWLDQSGNSVLSCTKWSINAQTSEKVTSDKVNRLISSSTERHSARCSQIDCFLLMFSTVSSYICLLLEFIHLNSKKLFQNFLSLSNPFLKILLHTFLSHPFQSCHLFFKLTQMDTLHLFHECQLSFIATFTIKRTERSVTVFFHVASHHIIVTQLVTNGLGCLFLIYLRFHSSVLCIYQ